MKIDLPTAIERIADAGFTEVELWARAPHLDATDPAYDVGAVLRTLVERGVKATSCHAPFGPHMNLASQDASVRKAGIDSLRSLLEPCAKLGVETIVVHPNVAPQGQTDEQAEASGPRIRESMAITGEIARPFGLRLAFENMLSAGRSQPCGAMAQLLELVDGLPDNIGLCFDTGHAFANGLDLAGEVRDSGRPADRAARPQQRRRARPPLAAGPRQDRLASVSGGASGGPIRRGLDTGDARPRRPRPNQSNLQETKAAIAGWGVPAGADAPLVRASG